MGVLMLMPEVKSLARDRAPMGKEESMSASIATNGQSSKGLRAWRILIFGGIGALYLISLRVPALRETLAQVFAFPR
ncbi:MAG: hypothetical protein DMF53_03670 [Acidobacteria bacterium]|nr:MAG: hypothetical protein DMF53_03670 [Acidobacteriota bacterium]